MSLNCTPHPRIVQVYYEADPSNFPTKFSERVFKPITLLHCKEREEPEEGFFSGIKIKVMVHSSEDLIRGDGVRIRG